MIDVSPDVLELLKDHVNGAGGLRIDLGDELTDER